MSTLDQPSLELEKAYYIENQQKSFNIILEKIIDKYLKNTSTLTNPNNQKEPLNSTLAQAMRYSLLNGGKRLRPLLMFATGELKQIPQEKLNAAAIAVECIHSYSLIHDDLPAMDNDTLRRGKPTCHVAFDEATAILAGDALQTLAFEILTHAELNPVSEPQKLAMVRTLAQAAGMNGMVGGQAFDIAVSAQSKNTQLSNHSPEVNTNKVNNKISLDILTQLHQKKTGALIKASVQMACIAGEFNPEFQSQLSLFADYFGLAFQLQDDILDVEGSSNVIGKTPGRDAALNKQTFPMLLGMDETKRYAQELYQNAHTVLLSITNQSSSSLHKLFDFFMGRVY